MTIQEITKGKGKETERTNKNNNKAIKETTKRKTTKKQEMK